MPGCHFYRTPCKVAGMTGHMSSDTVGANVRLIRKKRGWSVAELARRCAELGGGAEKLTAPIIENIEHGRRRDGERTRGITVDELIFLADALCVGPGVLLPTMMGTMEYPEDEREMVIDVLLGNMDAMRKLVEQVRVTRAAADLSGSGKLGV